MNADWFREKSSEEFLGRLGEKAWSVVFAASYVPYIPLHKIEIGKAPAIEGNSRTVLPDYQLVGRDFKAIVDAKGKTRSVLYYKLKEERHGIDRRHYLDYMRSGWATRMDAGIAVVELFRIGEDDSDWSGALLLGPFHVLGAPREGHGNNSGKMVYWPRSSFIELDCLTPNGLYELLVHDECKSYRDEILTAFGQSHFTQGMLEF